jgi:hypothetical protein
MEIDNENDDRSFGARLARREPDVSRYALATQPRLCFWPWRSPEPQPLDHEPRRIGRSPLAGMRFPRAEPSGFPAPGGSLLTTREGKPMMSEEGKGGVTELAPHQLKRNAFGAPSAVTKGEIIFAGISIVILLASIAYTAKWLIIGT